MSDWHIHLAMNRWTIDHQPAMYSCREIFLVIWSY